MEINEDDRKKILELFFYKMKSLEEIEKHFNGKYTYREIKAVTRKRIGSYNGYSM